MTETTHRGLRMAVASLLLVALLAQLAIGMSRSALTLANFFSFFTVLSNLAAVVLLVSLALKPGLDPSTDFAMFRGAVTVYMSVTGLVYLLLHAPIPAEVGVTEPWIDWSIHVVGPIVIALDWILHPPPIRLPGKATLLWVIFPAAYLTYSLIRGALVDWYPYPFLDPATGGYPSVALWSGVVLAVILGFGYAYLWWSNSKQAMSVRA